MVRFGVGRRAERSSERVKEVLKYCSNSISYEYKTRSLSVFGSLRCSGQWRVSKRRRRKTKAMFYTSKMLIDAETRYIHLEKMVLALIIAEKKLMHFFFVTSLYLLGFIK